MTFLSYWSPSTWTFTIRIGWGNQSEQLQTESTGKTVSWAYYNMVHVKDSDRIQLAHKFLKMWLAKCELVTCKVNLWLTKSSHVFVPLVIAAEEFPVTKNLCHFDCNRRHWESNQYLYTYTASHISPHHNLSSQLDRQIEKKLSQSRELLRHAIRPSLMLLPKLFLHIYVHTCLTNAIFSRNLILGSNQAQIHLIK